VYSAIADTSLDGDIPVDVLLRLPEWSVYVECSNLRAMGEVCHGFFAHLQCSTARGLPSLALGLDLETGLYFPNIPIGPWSVGEAVRRATPQLPANDVNPLLFAAARETRDD